MKTLMIGVLAATGIGMAAPTLALAAPMQVAQVDVRIGTHEHDRDYRVYDHRHGCKTVTIRERHGDRVVVRKIRRCR
jgi:hypothetical protein